MFATFGMAGALEHADSHQRSGEVALAVGTIGFGCAQPLGNPERLPEGGACLFALPEGAIHVQVSALRLTRNSRPGTSIASRSCGQMYGRAGSICCVLGSCLFPTSPLVNGVPICLAENHAASSPSPH